MAEANYWTTRVPRRMVIRGVGLGAAGLAGAALLGCGGGGEQAAAPATGGAGGTVMTPGQKVPPEQVRVKPGFYDGIVPPSAAELDPLTNGRYGGTLVGTYLDPPSMDFNRTLSCTVNTTMDYTKNKLVRADFRPSANQAKVDIEPDLAERWEVSPDQTVFTFHLRKGVRFHNVAPANGKELTSADVKASIGRYRAGGVQKDVWEPAMTVETPDAYTVKVTLSEPLSDFPRNIAAWSHIDAEEIVAAPEILRQKAIGTGPFIQQEWIPKERSVFVRNPAYFEKGLPFLDRVITVVQNDTAATKAAYLTNNFFMWVAPNEEESQQVLRQTKDSVYLKRPRAQGLNTDGFHFQMKNPRWQDERVRRAFSLVLDRVEWDVARQGDDNMNGYSISPIAWPFLHDKIPTLASHGKWYQFDLAEGRRLLQAAGYSASNPAVADAPVWYWREVYQSIMKPMYEKVPEIKWNVRIVDNPTAVQMLNDRAYEDTMNVTWGPPAYSVDQMIYPWYYSRGGLNHANVNDAEMDRLLKQQRSEKNPEAQKLIWKKIEDRIYDQVWQVLFPTAMVARRFYRNWVLNWRDHGIASFSCYGNAQTRWMWLDEGAPQMGV